MAVTTVNLTTASIEVDKFNGTLSAKESGALSAYNSDMKKLIRKVKKLPDYNSDTYYIMLVERSDDQTLGGFMPVNSNFGFVFAKANSGKEQLNRTIAHELAHGAFRLWHTFSSENIYVAQQGSTKNLMDYNGTNSELYKYQWDYIHNPEEGIVKWMVDDEEGEAILNKDVMLTILKLMRDANAKGDKTLSLTLLPGFNCSFSGKIELDDEIALGYLSMITYMGNKENEKIITTIKPFEKVCTTEKFEDDTEYTTYKFRSIKSNELTSLSFTVKTEEKDLFEKYVYTNGIDISDKVQWVSQFDESIFEKCTGCWKSACCRRACEYMLGNAKVANCDNADIAKSAPSMAISRTINLASFVNNEKKYKKDEYNNEMLVYYKEQLDDGSCLL